MSSRRQQRKEEERKVEEILFREEEARRKEVCIFCERTVDHAAGESRIIPLDSMKVFEDMPVCYQCHQQLHRLHKNRVLARHLDNVEAVKDDPQFSKYLKWVKKLPPGTIYT